MSSKQYRISNRPSMEAAFANARAAEKPMLKEQVKKNLRIQDEINAISRYTWYNLPSGLDGQMLERMLYYRYQLALFYVETLDEFFLLPLH